jgi:hypothetical protein
MVSEVKFREWAFVLIAYQDTDRCSILDEEEIALHKFVSMLIKQAEALS